MQEGAAQLVDRVRQKPNALKQWRACEVLVIGEVRSLRYLVITPRHLVTTRYLLFTPAGSHAPLPSYHPWSTRCARSVT